ncbi:MAG: hypothetical protein ACYCW6_08460 [Candidatus Xenobia bacterium]
MRHMEALRQSQSKLRGSAVTPQHGIRGKTPQGKSGKGSREFLVYWLPDQLHVGKELIGAWGAQMRFVKPGDRLWLVTILDGELILMGRVKVSRIVDEQGEFSARCDDEDRDRQRKVSLSSVAAQLSFKSKQAPTLTLDEGKVTAFQLQSKRELTTNSVALLEEAWEAPGAG